nr:MAG TPA: hypothetical protein [Caudoviricetes sp.]
MYSSIYNVSFYYLLQYYLNKIADKLSATVQKVIN